MISGQTTGTIQTVESSQTFYGNNLRCSWIINGGANTRIQLNVTGVDLQWAPTYTLCTDYDNLQIRDGKYDCQGMMIDEQLFTTISKREESCKA